MAAPTISSITPSSGSSAGGETVLIVGTGLETVTAVRFGAAPAGSYVVHSDTLLAATAPAHVAGEVLVAVTNPDGTSQDEVGYTYTGGPVLFTVAEARAFDKGQLANAAVFSDLAITNKEVDIRAKFERIIGVALVPTVVTEYHDGDGADTLYLDHHNPWTESTPRPVDVASIAVIASDDTETTFTEAELADVVKYSYKLVRRSGRFVRGSRNIRVTYTHGHVTVPADIKTAALLACVQELMPTNVASNAIDGADGQINWSRVKDPARGRWYGNESIDAVLRDYRALENLPVIA